MRLARFLVIPVFLFALLGCGLANGIQQIKQAVTQLPGALTGMPTMMGVMSTMAAGQAGSGTPVPATLGISLDTVKSLQVPGRFSYTDSTEGGQPVTTAVLTPAAATSFPGVAEGFSARFIGDPANLSQILITVPNTKDPATAFMTIGLIDAIFTGLLSPTASSTLLPWVTQTYAQVVSSGSQQQTTIQNLQFTMKSSNSSILLEVDPAP
jgi:hypothetical protein